MWLPGLDGAIEGGRGFEVGAQGGGDSQRFARIKRKVEEFDAIEEGEEGGGAVGPGNQGDLSEDHGAGGGGGGGEGEGALVSGAAGAGIDEATDGLAGEEEGFVVEGLPGECGVGFGDAKVAEVESIGGDDRMDPGVGRVGGVELAGSASGM